MPNQEQVDKFNQDLEQVREIRLDKLPEQGSLIEVVADAMNALQVAYIMLAAEATSQKQAPQGATFVPVSNPQDAKQL